jgi:hypothetical protein
LSRANLQSISERGLGSFLQAVAEIVPDIDLSDAAAVVSHDKADHLLSHELSQQTGERSTTKRKHNDEVAAEVAKPDKE